MNILLNIYFYLFFVFLSIIFFPVFISFDHNLNIVFSRIPEVTTNIYLAAGILIAAGIYQLTPLKTVCLENCRQPASFLAGYKNTWVNSPLRIGLVHGFYCVGCCWFLMALLFFGGIMNLYWIVGLIIFVAIEKLHEKGVIFGKVLGGGAVFLGIAFLANS